MQARLNPLLSPGVDAELERVETDVEIEPQVFEDYVADLKRDQEMARFDSAFVTVPTGYGAGTSLAPIARLLLARAIVSGDVSGTVETFRSYIEKNSAPMIAVMAVWGAKTTREVRLGPDILLLPLTSVPPSWPRWEALGHTPIPSSGSRDLTSSPASAALVTDLDFGPIFYWPTEGGFFSAAAQQRTTSAFHDLDEARMLLSLLGISTSLKLFWVHPKDPLMRAGANAGWLSGRERFDGKDVEVDVDDAEALAAVYFGMDPTRRQETLHIPLDRLERAIRGDDLADRSIDLGIALEALLLHELDDDRGELRFRLSLRGAWLGGIDPQERAKIQRTLKDVYDLRSSAVHTGRVEPNQKNYETIASGTSLCRQLILKMIQADGRVDWSTLLLGGPTGEA